MAYDMLVSEKKDGLTVHLEACNGIDCFVFRDKGGHATVKWPQEEKSELIRFLDEFPLSENKDTP